MLGGGACCPLCVCVCVQQPFGAHFPNWLSAMMPTPRPPQLSTLDNWEAHSEQGGSVVHFLVFCLVCLSASFVCFCVVLFFLGSVLESIFGCELLFLLSWQSCCGLVFFGGVFPMFSLTYMFIRPQEMLSKDPFLVRSRFPKSISRCEFLVLPSCCGLVFVLRCFTFVFAYLRVLFAPRNAK